MDKAIVTVEQGAALHLLHGAAMQLRQAVKDMRSALDQTDRELAEGRALLWGLSGQSPRDYWTCAAEVRVLGQMAVALGVHEDLVVRVIQAPEYGSLFRIIEVPK